MWETRIIDTRSGRTIERVYPQDFPWSSSIIGNGEAKTLFIPDDAERPLPRPAAELFRPNACSIDLRWGDHVAYRGKIEAWDYDIDSGGIVVDSVELPNEFKYRMTYGVANYGDGTLSVPGRSESGAVARILSRFMGWGDGWLYPIDLPADAPGDFTETWEYWRRYRIADLIAQVRERGFEVYFRPYVTADGTARYQTRVAPQVRLGTSSFKLQAAESPLSKVSRRVDGTGQLTGVQGLGNGSGEDQETAYAWAMAGEDIPFRDARVDFPDLRGDALQKAATEALRANRNALVQWSVKEFNVSDQWTPEHAAVGRTWQLESYGNKHIPDGSHMLRVVRTSGNPAGAKSHLIRTEVQSARA